MGTGQSAALAATSTVRRDADTGPHGVGRGDRDLSRPGLGLRANRAPGWRGGTGLRQVGVAAVLSIALAVGVVPRSASATDPSHDGSRLPNYCGDCHVLHNAPGVSLTNVSGNANLCMSCHALNGLLWSANDQAVPGSSGSSHRWDAAAVNSGAGAGQPSASAMAIRLNSGKLTCSVCHDQHLQQYAPFDPMASATPGKEGRMFQRVANNTNQMCEDCHAARVMSAVKTYTGAAMSHPVQTALTGSATYHLPPKDIGGATQVAAGKGKATGGSTTSLVDSGQNWGALTGQYVRFTSGANTNTVRQISSNTATQVNFSALGTGVVAGVHYEIDADGNLTNNLPLDNNGTPSFTAGKVRCMTCHGVHYADSNSSTWDGSPSTGDGNLLRRSNNNDACTGCHNVAIHSSATTSAKYGTWGTDFTCQTCHDPHGSKSILLVRDTIATPNSGNKTVDFRNRTGTADNSYATASVPGNGICEVCHTKTVNGDGSARFRNTGGGDGGKHYAGNCIDCHSHATGFKGSESGGNGDCASCHDYDMRVTDAARTNTYHHVMEAPNKLSGGVSVYPTAAQPTLSTNDVDKTCLQCHADHNVFRTDKNSANNLGRAANLRTRIGNAPPTGSTVTAAPGDSAPGWYSNRDQDPNFTAGGVCLSCHTAQQARNAADQKDAGTTVTPAVSASGFQGSAHTYAVPGQFSGDASAFTVNCVKCHNSNTATSKQDGTHTFQLHTSVDRSLRAPLGMTNPTDAMEEKFCYRCHHKTSDSNPGGGAAKSVSGKDWYNVANMSAGAEGIYGLIHTGSGGSSAPTCGDSVCNGTETPAFCPSDCPPTCGDGTCEGDETNASCAADCPVTNVTTNTLYFKAAAEESPSEPMPNAHEASVSWQGGTWIGRVMSPNAPTVNYETKTQNITRTSTRYWRMVTFCSPAIATAKTIPSNTWNFYAYGRESSGSANAYFRYTVYRWTAADENGGTIISPRTGGSELCTSSAPGCQRSWSRSDDSRSFNAGDKICIDLFLRSGAGNSNYNASFFWGNNAAGRVVMPTTMTFGSGASGASAYCGDGTCGTGENSTNCQLDCTGTTSSGSTHDVEKYSGKHRSNPTDEDRAYLSANKHVECSDCHSPHEAAAGLHTQGTNNVSGALSGVTGAIATFSNTNFTAPTGWSMGTATKEHQICFKCHSSFNTNLSGWNANWTDVARDFSPSNGSYHPVVSALPTTDPGANGSSRLQSSQLTGGWSPGQTMYCSDCHGGAAASPASQGPHGSAVSYMLKGPNTAWPLNSSGQLATRNSMNGVFCNNCHTTSNSLHEGHGKSDHRAEACIRCHILVPHGGKLSRLIGDKNSMPPRLAYQGNLANNWVTSFTKRPMNSYNKSDCGSDNGSCSDHNGVNASENW